MSFFGQGNFKIKHEYRDFYTDVQRNTERIGDVGNTSKDFSDRSYDQFKMHDFNELAKNQDAFVPPDEMYGTVKRDNFRNYNRMEYDMPERHDGKEHADVKKEVEAKTEVTIDKLLNAFKDQGYTLNSTASTVKDKPIEKEDYDGQIRLVVLDSDKEQPTKRT